MKQHSNGNAIVIEGQLIKEAIWATGPIVACCVVPTRKSGRLLIGKCSGFGFIFLVIGNKREISFRLAILASLPLATIAPCLVRSGKVLVENSYVGNLLNIFRYARNCGSLYLDSGGHLGSSAVTWEFISK